MAQRFRTLSFGDYIFLVTLMIVLGSIFPKKNWGFFWIPHYTVIRKGGCVLVQPFSAIYESNYVLVRKGSESDLVEVLK